MAPAYYRLSMDEHHMLNKDCRGDTHSMTTPTTDLSATYTCVMHQRTNLEDLFSMQLT